MRFLSVWLISVENEDEDAANVLTYLIYIRELIRYLDENEPEFRTGNLDIICEIRNPKNEDIVRNYGAGRVIISNRYVGSVIAKISLEETGYELFAGKTGYEESAAGNLQTVYAADFFECIPGKCSAAELIRMAYAGSTYNRRPMIIGYIHGENDYIFFSGDQRNIEVSLSANDRLIVFSTGPAT